MGSVYIWISAVVAILVWEFSKTAWLKDKLGYLFFIARGLSFVPILIGLATLSILFLMLHQMLAAYIVGGLTLIELIFRITNEFDNQNLN